MYDDFASVYDTLMDDFDYDAWSAHYLTLIRTVTGELPRRAAECACGTGSLTVRLAQSGMAVTGVDLSAAMLSGRKKGARLRRGSRVCSAGYEKTDASQTGRRGAGHMRRRELSDNAERRASVFCGGISKPAAGRRTVL